ncbi:type II toxin-antitoxin system RelE/ParE family toxin [Arcobacter acticola]|uniref:type II toxin-antitoxin system RelE/ParE family toxin n=1 Tax=Arcobacter acticola TaxID=1849015 RepID=UPI001552250A
METLTLEQSKRFKKELDEIILFIEIDCPNSVYKFFEDIISKIKTIPNNPYIYRKREDAKDENLRELIYKGYTIPFKIKKIIKSSS